MLIKVTEIIPRYISIVVRKLMVGHDDPRGLFQP